MTWAALLLAVLAAGYILGVWTGGLVFHQRQGPYEDPVPARGSGPTRDGSRQAFASSGQTLVIRGIRSPRRLEAIDWRGPPELIERQATMR